MDGVLMAGGKGQRMRPLVHTNGPKHLIPVGDHPLLWHVMRTLESGGVTKLIIALDGTEPDQTMCEITSYALNFPCCYTHSNAGVNDGPVHELFQIQPWLTPNQPFAVVFSDSFFATSLDFSGHYAPHIWTMNIPSDADPSQFGQVITTGNRVTRIIEKPEQQQSKLMLTGAMILPPDIFGLAQEVCCTTEGEVHFGHLLQALAQNRDMSHTVIPDGSFIDVGRPKDWQRAHALALSQQYEAL